MTPILAAVHVDTLIWIVLLIIGAIGSIASNAKKAAAVRRPVPQARPIPAAPPVAVTVAPPPPAPVIVPRPRPPAVQPRPKESAPPPLVTAPPHGTTAFRGMFERGNLARAVVAAEVLGPPRAFQEQSIWSPRHSEPSI